MKNYTVFKCLYGTILLIPVISMELLPIVCHEECYHTSILHTPENNYISRYSNQPNNAVSGYSDTTNATPLNWG